MEGLTIIEDGLLLANRKRIAELAIRSRLPSVGFREYCEAGGLAAYGVDFPYTGVGELSSPTRSLKGPTRLICRSSKPVSSSLSST